MKINIISIINSLSKAQSVVSPELGMHQQQVAYLSYRIAEALDLPQTQRTKLLVAGLCHDIGALSLQEKIDALVGTTADINTHAFRGAYLVSHFLPQKQLAPIIKYHHYLWNNGKSKAENPDLPLESQILHLADRVCAGITGSTFVLSQVPLLKEYVRQGSGMVFVPRQADVFLKIADKECLWLDLISEDPINRIDQSYIANIEVSIDDLLDLSKIYSQIIDFRSPFTSTHSASVASVAEKLAELLHFSPLERKYMLIAGYLHDLGKLTVDNAILEKQSALDPEEFAVIRSHTYYTYYLLDNIEAFHDIKAWAAYHHERLNGTGYPFHINGDGLSLGARIMAVADVFSALQEKRPYKDGLSQEKILSILRGMVKTESLDGDVVQVVAENFPVLSKVCTEASDTARRDYEALYQIGPIT